MENSVLFDYKMNVENISLLENINPNNNIPVEVFRDLDESIWKMERRDISWEMDSCGFIWIRKDKR